MLKYCARDFSTVNAIIANITKKSIPDYTVVICESNNEYLSTAYPNVNKANFYLPDYMAVSIDRENNIITTRDSANINLYIFYFVYGSFNSIHYEWLEMLTSWARLGFPNTRDIQNDNPKAKFFAGLYEKFGFQKLIEWNETIDLQYYYRAVFGEECERHIENNNLSFYEAVLRGEAIADEDVTLALYIDEKYRSESRLEVFYSDCTLTKAVIKYRDSVLGFVNITADGNVISYVADYRAWERRRASGYARNNPYDEQDFKNKVLAYAEASAPRILEIGIGSGRIAKPFITSGYEYYGIDINDSMTDECRANFGQYENLHIIKHNIFNGLPFDNADFDIVIESRVITDIEVKPFIMSEIRRVLRPGGVAILAINDNYEKHNAEPIQLLWGVYKSAYYNRFNISDCRSHPQNLYSMELAAEGEICNGNADSDYIIPEADEVYTVDNPFSVCEYEFDLLQSLKDNIYHMAFFRTEPLFEPCGTEFFRTMRDTAEKAFGSEKYICKRYTSCKIYKLHPLTRSAT